MKGIKRTLIGFIVLLCFLNANVGSEGLVLCFGENGHVSVESPHGEICNKFSPSIHDFNFKKHKNHCVDFALSVGSLEQYVSSKSLETIITAPVVAVVSEQFTPQLNRAGPELFILPTPTINISVEYLRTVVLLI